MEQMNTIAISDLLAKLESIFLMNLPMMKILVYAILVLIAVGIINKLISSDIYNLTFTDCDYKMLLRMTVNILIYMNKTILCNFYMFTLFAMNINTTI